jgi:hypothetical protein
MKLLSWIDRRNAIHITVAQVDFTLKALEPLILPPYKGSTLRGGFGAAFRRIVCVIRDKECADCLLKGTCVYSYIFETPPPADTAVMRKYQAAPHPFVIEPPMAKGIQLGPLSRKVHFEPTSPGAPRRRRTAHELLNYLRRFPSPYVQAEGVDALVVGADVNS